MAPNIFSAADIQRLIEAFPPPEPRPGKECLVRSRSGKNLVRSDAIAKRFKALLNDARLPLVVSNLSAELGVQDVHWLLEQETSDLFFTRDRERIVPKPRQREICESLRTTLQSQGLRLSEWAGQYNLSADVLQRMASDNLNLTIITLEDGITYDEENLKQARSSLLNLLQNGGDEPVNLSELYQIKGHPPDNYLEKTCEEIITEDSNRIQGQVERKADGLYFIPASALTQLQKQQEEAKTAYVHDALQKLKQSGYCNVSVSQRPAILQSSSTGTVENLYQDIRAAYEEEFSGQALVLLQTSTADSNENGGNSFLVRQDTFDGKKQELALGASQVASEMWMARVVGSDVSFDLETFAAAVAEAHAEAGADAVSFEDAVIRSEYTESVRSVFEEEVAKLQEKAGQQLSDLLRSQLLGPLWLYSKSVEGITDIALQTRVLEFVTEWARRTLVPAVLLSIRVDKLAVAKTTLREVEKFGEAVQAAKTLNEVNTAAARLARKQKIDQPDKVDLAKIKHLILAEKVQWLRRVKRSSDLLQNLTWVLLASTMEGLFMSSGKDTSRMIKLFQTDGDTEIGKRLGELRDIVKEGKETDEEKAEMREMAKVALNHLQSAEAAS